jgi:hypothetical protein
MGSPANNSTTTISNEKDEDSNDLEIMDSYNIERDRQLLLMPSTSIAHIPESPISHIVRPIPMKINHVLVHRQKEAIPRTCEPVPLTESLHAAMARSHEWLEDSSLADGDRMSNGSISIRSSEHPTAWLFDSYSFNVGSVRETGAKNPSPSSMDDGSWDHQAYKDSVGMYARSMQQDFYDKCFPSTIAQHVPQKPKPPRHPIVKPIPLRVAAPSIVSISSRNHFRNTPSHPSVTPSLSPHSEPSRSNTPHDSNRYKTHIATHHRNHSFAPLPVTDTTGYVQESTTTHRPSGADPVRDGLLQALAVQGGDVKHNHDFYRQLHILTARYQSHGGDSRLPNTCSTAPRGMEGSWLTLSNASFGGSLGQNDKNDHLYTLGRMAFDMFFPKDLVCSLQGNFNYIYPVSDFDREFLNSVPDKLRKDVKEDNVMLHTYK